MSNTEVALKLRDLVHEAHLIRHYVSCLLASNVLRSVENTGPLEGALEELERLAVRIEALATLAESTSMGSTGGLRAAKRGR